MHIPPAIPDNEAERLAALRRLEILDTAPEERFERLVRITRTHFNVPIALMSLVDTARQWFKSHQGIGACETARDISFCGHAILSDATLYVPDTSADARFASNPLVLGDPHLRFYAGAPLRVAGGLRVGTLCIADHAPRHLTDDDLKMLRDLADCLEFQLEHSRLRNSNHALAVQEARLSALLNTVVDAIVTINTKGEVDSFNPAAERMFGYAAAEVLGRNVNMLMPAPYREEHDGYLSNYLSTGEAKVIGIGREVTGRRKNGSEFPMELAVSEMVVDGQRMFTGVVRDITERRRADIAKREFVSTVSHELRTPLTSIKGSLGLIQSGAIGSLPPRLKHMLDIAYSNSDRLVRLINDLLDIEKIEAGKMDFTFAPLDMSALVNQAMDANRNLGTDHGVRLVRADRVASAPIRGDYDRLMQVFANLLSNAVKFSPPNGVVTISLRDNGDHVRVSVADQGPGIPESFREKVFSKFSQADSSDTRTRGGTGLGLNVSKSIIEQHGGMIDFTTKLGEGTEFSFILPAIAAAPRPPEDDATGTSRRRILICEDEANLVNLLQLILAQDGYATDVAFNAADAERKLRERSYDAMTLDLCLPDKNGIALLRDIRENPETKDLPVVVVSVTERKGNEYIGGNGIGILDWIQKPIRHDRLLESLRRAVRPQRAGSCSILHVEDDPDILAIVSAVVGDLAKVHPATSVSVARDMLDKHKYDLVILDMTLPDGEGEGLLPIIRASMNKNTPVVVFSAREISAETARSVNKALIKSRTTNEDLLALIRSAMDSTQSTD